MGYPSDVPPVSCLDLDGVEELLQGAEQETDPCYKVAVDSTLGRHLVATRFVPAGSLIMACKPLVVGPKVAARPVCLGCCSVLEGGVGAWHSCSRCGWPLCARACEAAPLHRPECAVLARAAFSPGGCYAAIAPLRCLLLPAAPLRAVRALQSHLQERLQTPAYSERGVQRSAARFLRHTLGLGHLSEEDVLAMAATLDTNAFDIGRGDKSCRALYGAASLLSHDCQPNARCALLPEPDAEGVPVPPPPRLQVFAQRDVAEGGILSISYYGDSLRGSLQRRSHLRATKCFDCGCARCADPRDLGLYMDSIRCIHCRARGRSSLLVPIDPLDADADWRCPRSECGFSLSVDQMLLGHKRLRSQVTSVDLVGRGAVDTFLGEHLGPDGLLHPSSTHVLHLKYTLLTSVYGYHRPGYTFPEMNDQELDAASRMCSELLQAVEVAEPGLCMMRGSLMLAKYGIFWETARRKLLGGEVQAGQVEALNALQALGEAERALLDSESRAELEDRKRLSGLVVKGLDSDDDLLGFFPETLKISNSI